MFRVRKRFSVPHDPILEAVRYGWVDVITHIRTFASAARVAAALNKSPDRVPGQLYFVFEAQPMGSPLDKHGRVDYSLISAPIREDYDGTLYKPQPQLQGAS